MLTAEAAVAWAEGDADTALEKSRASIESEDDGFREANVVAGQIWWTGRIFGEDAAGGPAVVRAARDRLEAHHWNQALAEPEMLLEGAVPRT
jgi:hypothetical protein